MNIVRMTPDHLNGVKALLDICFGDSAWSADNLRSQLKKPGSLCTVAAQGEEIVGFLAFEQVLDEGSIVEVAVHPDHRRQGIARELICSAWDDHSLKEIFLEVRESNLPAIQLYKSLGFEPIGVRKDYYDSPKENAVIMRKTYENTCNRKQL